MRNLLDRMNNVVTEDKDKELEEEKLNSVGLLSVGTDISQVGFHSESGQRKNGKETGQETEQ